MVTKEKTWQPLDLRVVVVAGRAAREQAKKFGLYWNHNRRSFAPSKWMAFYADGAIDTLAKIDGPPEDDVIFADRPELADLAEDLRRLNVDPNRPRTLVRLRNVTSIGPVANDKTDSLGRRTAWVQSHRYTTIERLRQAKHTSEL